MRAKLEQDAIPGRVRAVASALRSAPARAFLVGGPVRDLLQGKEPEDWDIATDLSPRQVLEVFPGAVTVGIEFGRVQVDGVDIVSLRAESRYLDRRHPSSVSFGVPVEQDLRRRDFTVNAMAAEFPGLEVIDPLGGLDDLRDGILRTVGDPGARFSEDPLRILRAVRFKTTLRMALDPAAALLIPEMASLLSEISGERTFAELRRILLAPCVRQGILDLRDLRIGRVILPQVFNGLPEDVALVSIALVESAPDLCTRLALLFIESGRDPARVALARFNVDSGLRQDVDWVLSNACARQSGYTGADAVAEAAYVARKLVDSGGPVNVERLIDLERALWRARGNPGLSAMTAALADGLAQVRDRMPGPLALTGDDVMKTIDAGGPLVGQALAHLKDLVLRDPGANTKGSLTDALRAWWKRR